jgi:hypothetical protein
VDVLGVMVSNVVTGGQPRGHPYWDWHCMWGVSQQLAYARQVVRGAVG